MEKDSKKYKRGIMSKYKGVIAILLTMVLGLGACGANAKHTTDEINATTTDTVEETIDHVTEETTQISETIEENSDETETVESMTETTVQPEREPTELPVFTQIPEEPVTEEDRLIFGQMNIPLQEGYNVEVVTAADGMEAVCLSTTAYKYEFPVEMFLRHYRVEWKDSQSTKELMVALLELTGMNEIESLRVYDNEALFTLSKEGGYGTSAFAFIREDEVYLVEQPAGYGNFTFDWWRYEESIYAYWQDSGEKLGFERNPNKYGCLKIEEEDDKTYYAYWAQKKYTFYEEGYLNTPLLTVKSEKNELEICGDINFDGYTDLERYSSDEWYLYDPATGMFVNADCNDALGGFPDVVYFPEEETIWTYDIDTSYGITIKKEGIWKWEGTTLKQVSSCWLNYGEEDAHFFVLEGNEYLVDVTVSLEQLENEPNMFREYYEEFYEGYVPAETYFRNHYAPLQEEYVPQGLLDVIAKAMYEKTELEILQAMVCDKEMTTEEVRAWAASNEAFMQEVLNMGYVDRWVFVMADGDNDGIDDVVIEEYGGGSGGFTEFVFYKGKEDGSFERTGSYGHVMEEFAFITFEGKNYLCRTTFDYDKKEYNGFDLFCYRDGVRVEEVELRLKPGEYNCELTDYANADYKAYVEVYLNKESCLDFFAMVEDDQEIWGDAEKPEEDYICDINNDGIAENYSKGIWYPSNISTQSILSFRCVNCPEIEAMVYNGEAEGMPMMMWVSAHEGKNITNILYRTGLYDFNIVGYLMEGDDYTQVYCVEAVTDYEVVQGRFGVYDN